jgi:hypothetical protein
MFLWFVLGALRPKQTIKTSLTEHQVSWFLQRFPVEKYLLLQSSTYGGKIHWGKR